MIAWLVCISIFQIPESLCTQSKTVQVELQTVLKPGLVNWVTFYLGHLGQIQFKIIRVWPRLDHMRHEIKIWRCNDADISFSWVTPTFVIILWCQLAYGRHIPFRLCKNPNTYKLATPINQLLLQPLGVLLLQYVSFMWECCCAKYVHHRSVDN